MMRMISFGSFLHKYSHILRNDLPRYRCNLLKKCKFYFLHYLKEGDTRWKIIRVTQRTKNVTQALAHVGFPKNILVKFG